MESKWWKEGVVYQIYPRSFYDSNSDGIGDLRGIIRKIDYLKELGIDIIWLCPIYKSPNDDNGYDISDYYGIMDEFGTLDDWQELVEKLHAKEMRIIMDLVVNHTSDEHAWFAESRLSKSNPYRDYYIWRKPVNGKEPNNWKSFFQGSAWQYDKKTDEYYLHLFSKKQPDLNWENSNVRNEVYKMMTWWLDKGIDGFRMDVVNMLSKDMSFPDAEIIPGEKYSFGGMHHSNRERNHEYLREMNEQVLSKYDIMTVGECGFTSIKQGIMYTSPERKELDMIFQFELVDMDSGGKNRFELAGWDLVEFKKITEKWQKGLHGNGWNSLFLTNHDQPRAVSRYCNDSEFRVESAKLLMTYLMTLQGTPFIYQGEEIGMTNVSFDAIEDYNDIDSINYYKMQIEEGHMPGEVMHHIHMRGRDNARTPMQWDNSLNAGFSIAEPWLKINPNYTEINVQNDLEAENSIYKYTKSLISLRKENETLIYGKYISYDLANPYVFIYERFLGRERFLILLNFSEKNIDFYFPSELDADSFVSITSNYRKSIIENNFLHLEPYQAEIFLKN